MQSLKININAQVQLDQFFSSFPALLGYLIKNKKKKNRKKRKEKRKKTVHLRNLPAGTGFLYTISD